MSNQFFCPNFHDRIIDKMNNVTHGFNVIQVCDIYKGLLPISDCSHSRKRVMSAIINNDNVLDLSNTAVI